jgi:hypothetical protein
MSECCANCRFLVVSALKPIGPDDESRECRRHAPMIEPRISPTEPDRGWWPQVEADEWCGEWQARPAAEKDERVRALTSGRTKP